MQFAAVESTSPKATISRPEPSSCVAASQRDKLIDENIEIPQGIGVEQTLVSGPRASLA
jgi:hypothetical protein